MGLIIDTTLFVESERATGSVSGLKSSALLRRTGESLFGISTITLTELTYGQWLAGWGMEERKRERILRELRDNFAVFSMDERIAIRAGRLNYVLRNKGWTTGLADLLIASTALDFGFGVVTHNVKHFENFPDLKIVDANKT